MPSLTISSGTSFESESSAAMGSHGGADADGQKAILEGYGITEESTGAELRSSMEVVCLGKTEDGFDVWLDACAMEADYIIPR